MGFSAILYKFTAEEKKWFKWMDLAQIDIPLKKKTSTFYLLRWTGVGGGGFSEPFKIFMRKYFKDKYVPFYSYDYEHILFTQENIKDISKWEDGEFPGLKKLELKKDGLEVIILDDWNIKEKDAYNYRYWSDALERKTTCYQNINSYISIYINKIDKLSFTPVLELISNSSENE